MIVAPSKTAPSNPVYGSYFADPFVWRHENTYYAIGTGTLEASGKTIGKIFPLLQSTDFYQWQFASNALMRPDPAPGDTFWAPAIACRDGKFYLYYSVGRGDTAHQLRVAVGDAPQGPYRDTGRPLLAPAQCPFAIDPHPFQDEDGRWYLFYARDFLDTSDRFRPGTALVATPMKSPLELAEPETVILRAHSDWQRFRARRLMYGKVWDWHTLEGPCPWVHEGKYYCFYSGGCWEDDSYGVDYGVADHVLGPYTDAGNETGPRVLRTLPHQLIGPGHNTIVSGPDGDYIAYHAWDRQKTMRQFFLDKLTWTPDGPRCENSHQQAQS